MNDRKDKDLSSFHDLIDTKEFLRLYKSYYYHQDEKYIDEILKMIDPFINIVVGLYMRGDRGALEGTDSDAKQMVMVKIWKYAKRGTIPYSEKDLIAWLWKVIRGEYVREITRYKIKGHDYEFNNFKPSSTSLISPMDTDNYVFIQEIRQQVSSIVDHQLRFWDKELEVCKFALSRIIEGRKLVDSQLASMFNITRSKAKFFIQYIVCRVRVALYQIREDGDLETSWLDFLCNSNVVYNELIFSGDN